MLLEMKEHRAVKLRQTLQEQDKVVFYGANRLRHIDW